MSAQRHRTLRPIRALAAGAAATALTVAGLAAATAPAHAANGVPRYDHVVLVMEENHSYGEIIGSGTGAPYINNTLVAGGASFTQSFAIEHPSEPNYLDLFSGSNQGVTDDSCPHTFSTANEGAQLLAAGDTFKGYSEDLPSAGSTACTSGAYARKHNPWVNFTNVPAADNLPFTSFPTDFTTLPTVSWVVPNLNDDMHDGTIAQGDTWLQTNIDAYAQWAKTHNSLLVVTWDEDDSSMSNQIPTIFYGANVKTGNFSETINHYNVLRTIEDMYGLPYAGSASSATPITDVWNTAPVETVTVTNPGNQTSTQNTAISPLQISATDSAGKTLTYSATGLPAGLSISSSGSISGTPTGTGTSNVTVTASSGTASGSTSFTWTVNPPASETVTVTNPGNQTSTQNTAISPLQISATDSAGKTLTYSATGLPAGLLISSSGSISGTPTGTGTSNVTVTASSGTASGSTSFTWTVNPPATGGIVNGGFEAGTFTGWTASGASETVVNSGAHSGTYAARLGGTSPTNGDSDAAQTFTVPTGQNQLSFWYNVTCPDTVQYDWATATLKDNTAGTTSTVLAKTCVSSSGWTQVTSPVTAGHSYTLTLTSHDDNYSGDPTYTLFDDVALSAVTPPTNPIVNGGFETGNFTGWTTTGASETVVNSGAHSGTYAAQLGGTSPTNGDSNAAQTFTATGGGTLSLWYDNICPDTVQYDWATVTLKDNTANTTATLLAKTCTANSGWTKLSSSLTAGHSYTLTLTSHDDNYSGDPTYTLYDDVAVS